MRTRISTRIFSAAVLSCVAAVALCAEPTQPPAPDQAAVGAALAKYLAERGDFCLGKFDWPIDVSERDFASGTRDALQMPVLEKLGLVASSLGIVTYKKDDADEVVKVRRYALTEAGQKYYLNRKVVRTAADGGSIVHERDFCAGKLSLDQVVRWDTPVMAAGRWETTVTYTYKIAAADWTRNAEVPPVFPMVDRIVKGAGSLQLQQRLQFAEKSWTAASE